jgi:hypothetical protein
MNETHRRTASTGVKRIGMTLGVCAAFTMGVLGIGHSSPARTTSLAGSGDAPTNTTYSQPVVAGMNVGATATWTPPAPTEATAMAIPAARAH